MNQKMLLVLSAVSNLRGVGCCSSVVENLLQSGKELSFSGVYVLLKKCEDSGLVGSIHRVRMGRRRKEYAITAKGREELRRDFIITQKLKEVRAAREARSRAARTQ
jgi:DNA-binding PadR family transcriptional regulator